MTDALNRVGRAARKLHATRQEHRAAIQAAVDAGHSYAEIARAAGVTRQAVRQTITKGAKQQ